MTEINADFSEKIGVAYFESEEEDNTKDRLQSNIALPPTSSSKIDPTDLRRKIESELLVQSNLRTLFEDTRSASSISPVGSTTKPNNIEFKKSPNVAQYKGSSYTNAIRVARGITLEKAMEIARNDDEIDYFVYLKGGCMVLEIPKGVEFNPANDPLGLVTKSGYIYDKGGQGYGYCRIFYHGDTVFFKREGIWLGSAPGLADTYHKIRP